MIQTTFNTVRAVGAEFVRRTIKPLLVIGAVAAVVLLALGGWLASQNAWWWLIEAVFILGSLLYIGLLVLVRVVLQVVDPVRTNEQKQAVNDFVDKMQRVSENVQTPQFVIIYRVVRDTVRPRQHGFIETLSRDSKALAPDFVKLQRLFEK